MVKALKFAGLFLGAVLVAAILYLWFADFSRFKPRVEAAVSEATGRDFRIDGEFSVDVLPSPTILVTEATLSNAPWAAESDMLRVGHFSTKFGLWSLLFRPVVVHDLVLHDVTINLEVGADGKANWEFDRAPPDEKPDEDDGGSLESPVDVKHADIRNVKILYHRPDEEDQEFALADFSVESKEAGVRQFSAEAQLNELPIALDGTAVGEQVGLDASIGEVKLKSTLLTDDGAVEFDFSVDNLARLGTLMGLENLPEDDLSLEGGVDVDGTQVRLSGVVADLGSLQVEMDGTVDTGTSDARFAVKAMGKGLDIFNQDLPKLGFSVNADVSLAEQLVEFDPFELTFGESTLAGILRVDLRDLPAIELKAQSSRIDLSPFFPAEDESAGDEPAAAGKKAGGDGFVFGDDPLPLDGLRKANADVDVSIDQLILANTAYSDFVLRMKLADGNLDIDNGFKGKYGGTLENRISMDVGESQADLEIEVTADEMKLVALAGPDIDADMIPVSAINIALKARGESPRALASSADGTILFLQGPGRINNSMIGKLSGDIIAQLFSALNPFANSEEFTNWECSAFGIAFESGEGEIDTFLLQGEKIMVVGGGDIDLNTEKLNVEFNTKPRKGVGISADMFVTPFVALSGTLAEPTVGLNSKGVLLTGGAAFLTGGMSFLYQGLADRATAEAGQCEATFEAIDKAIPGA